mgnify:CR=1 FL=1|jgi:pimeloyl-ACP methyl ester carboxylesterase
MSLRAFLRAVILGAIVLVAAAAPAAAQSLAGYGVILMHGKEGGPGDLTRIADAIRAKGGLAVTPTMPWARGTLYAKGYLDAMEDMRAVAAQLKAQGAKKILVGGHSLGANAALFIGGHADVAGVIVIAPGHFPESPAFAGNPKVAADVARAKSLVETGQGDVAGTFTDLNQSNTLTVRATPKAYLSYLDPVGPASFGHNARSVKPVPVFFAVGTGEPSFEGSRRLFQFAAKNPKSKFVSVTGGHTDVPGRAAADIVAWLLEL